ncbi:MAG: TrkH family potassium uptake protein [Acidimicrobiales bacterium]|nr:TrkH family potassium uptake protein [Acidimicrobiales bacterium]
MTRAAAPARWAAGAALVAAGAGSALGAVADRVTGGPHASALGLSALGLALPGLALLARSRLPDRAGLSSVLTAVLAGWVVLALAAAVPYLATGTFDRPSDAVFEAVSGVTTTGMTVLRAPEQASRGVLLWRAATQWIGGLAVLVLVGAVLPSLGAGGANPAGAGGVHGGRNLSGRVRATVRRLGPVYVGFTAVVAAAYLVAGMGAFDAVAHALTTASTGGFSTHRLSIAAFGSAAVEWVACAAMVLAGLSLPFIWRALTGRPGRLVGSVEVRWYLGGLLAFGVVAAVWNSSSGGLSHEEIRHSLFTVASAGSTTGYWVTGIGGWLSPAQALLLLAMAIGPCSGSLGGGLKVERVLALSSWVRRDLLVQRHPSAVRPVRVGREPVAEEAARRMVGYFTVTFLLAMAAMVFVATLGADLLTAVSAVVSALANVGPALGRLAPPQTAADLGPGARAVLAVVMLVGRLEVFPVLVGLGAALHGARVAGHRVRARARGMGR